MKTDFSKKKTPFTINDMEVYKIKIENGETMFLVEKDDIDKIIDFFNPMILCQALTSSCFKPSDEFAHKWVNSKRILKEEEEIPLLQ
jgi:hypothetical protein